jgi:mRNA interferase MazF
MRRGDIYLAHLEPVQGSEADKTRPVVIVTNDSSNKIVDELGAGMVTVVPLTSSVERILPFQVFLPSEVTGLRADSKAQPEQIRAVSSNRLRGFLGRIPKDYLEQLDNALQLHLSL